MQNDVLCCALVIVTQWFSISTISMNINKSFSFFQVDLLRLILCQTSVISTVSLEFQ
jgi:hypothetical protein